MKKLKKLVLEKCSFQNFASSSFESLHRLESLSLVEPQGHAGLDLSPFVKLEQLEIDDFGGYPEYLKTVNRDLGNLSIRTIVSDTNKLAEALGRLEKLQDLSICLYKKLNYFDINWLADPTSLQSLEVKNIAAINLKVAQSKSSKIQIDNAEPEQSKNDFDYIYF